MSTPSCILAALPHVAMFSFWSPGAEHNVYSLRLLVLLSISLSMLAVDPKGLPTPSGSLTVSNRRCRHIAHFLCRSLQHAPSALPGAPHIVHSLVKFLLSVSLNVLPILAVDAQSHSFNPFVYATVCACCKSIHKNIHTLSLLAVDYQISMRIPLVLSLYMPLR